MSETPVVIRPNRKIRRFNLSKHNDVLAYACARCKKPFVAPLAEKCQCKVLRPDELREMRT